MTPFVRAMPSQIGGMAVVVHSRLHHPMSNTSNPRMSLSPLSIAQYTGFTEGWHLSEKISVESYERRRYEIFLDTHLLDGPSWRQSSESRLESQHGQCDSLVQRQQQSKKTLQQRRKQTWSLSLCTQNVRRSFDRSRHVVEQQTDKS